MQLAEQSIKNLTQTSAKLRRTLENSAGYFSTFAQEFDGTRCPEQSELVPFLKSVQGIALALAEFLEALRAFLTDRNAVAALRRIPSEERGLGGEAHQLLDFYGACGSLANKLREQDTTTTYVWQQTYELCVWFAYLGSSMTATSSLISSIPFVTQLFREESSSKWWGDDEYLKLAVRILKEELIQGLYHISRRADLLVNTPESELKSHEFSWWCQRVDSTPKDRGAYYKLRSLIAECPDPAHPDAVARLKQIATGDKVDEDIREEALLKLKDAA